MTDTNAFAEALEAYDPLTLRSAFDACQERSKVGYDRTTLNQWLKGSVPRKDREEFVQCLADELDDPGLLDAWQTARGHRGSSPIRNVVGRFESLSPDERDEAFHNIRRVYVSNFEQEMSRLSYRVEITDSTDPVDDHLIARLTLGFEGRVPPDARAEFTTSPRDLGNAYDDSSCLFREILAFDRSRLEELLDGTEQVLTFTPLTDDNPSPVSHSAQRSGLTFSFENEASDKAYVTLDLEYPFPRGRPVFFLRFGRYYVPDYAEVSLTLSSRSTTDPQAFVFLPPGRQRAFSSIPVRTNELRVSLGTDNTVLSEGDGMVLYWTETAP